jgi:hypothetical protein
MDHEPAAVSKVDGIGFTLWLVNRSDAEVSLDVFTATSADGAEAAYGR